MNPRVDCGPQNRYLSDVHLVETLFSLALFSAVGNFMLQELEKDFSTEDPQWFVNIMKFFFVYLQNAYILWLFSSILAAAIFAERWWLKITKADFLPRRELASLFIYEAAVLLLPLLVLMFIADYQLFEPLKPEVYISLRVYLIFGIVHVLIFFFRLGARAKLSIWKRTWSSILLAYLLIFAAVPGMLVTLPFYFLPLLLIVYPLYAISRDFIPKPAIVRRFFNKVQKALES
jgi:hypothetical protein